MRGSGSDVVSPEAAQHFLALVPHADFVDVAEAGHMLVGDANETFGREARAFLDKIRATADQASV